MEEMENKVIENIETAEVVETFNDLTLGQKCAGYAVSGIFLIGVATIGYAGYKGTEKLIKHIRNKKVNKEEEDETTVDIDETEIHEVYEENQDEE